MEDQQQKLDIKRYVQIVYKKRHVFIPVAALIMTLCIVASYFRPDIYEASTTVSIEKNYLNVLMRDIAVAPSMEQQMQALSIVMTSRSMLTQVLADLAITMEAKTEAEIDGLIHYFQKRTQIRFDLGRANRSNMDIFTVTYRDRDPRFARDYVNALVRRYVVENLSTNQAEALGANRFLYEQMELYKKKIDRIDKELDQRKKQRGVQTAGRLAELQRKYDDLLLQYTNEHPEVVRLKIEIDSTRQQIREQERAARKTGTEGANAAPSGSVDSGNRKAIADLERDKDAFKKVYESLVASLGRSEVSAQVEAQTKADKFNILEPATTPSRPVSKPRWIMILMGIAAGIAGGAGTVILLDMMDRTIKTVDALKALGLPVIGVIPRIQSAETIVAARRKDVVAYTFTGVYLAGVAVILALEYWK